MTFEQATPLISFAIYAVTALAIGWMIALNCGAFDIEE